MEGITESSRFALFKWMAKEGLFSEHLVMDVVTHHIVHL
jgi:hypothetical protein